MLALVYMLCVLAPGVSFAFADAARAAPCLTDENHGLGIVHVHDHNGPAQHFKNSHAHDHSSINAHLVQADSNSNDVKPVAAGTTDPADDPHKASGTPCCGMVCLSAIPATVIDIVKPSAPISTCESENYRNVIDNAPPRLYRPPIS